MVERCPFEGSCDWECTLGDGFIEVNGHCLEGAQGEVCGPVLAYEILQGTHKGLVVEDIVYPISGTFRVDSVPSGHQPDKINRMFIGVELPVRHIEDLGLGQILVSQTDVILSLLGAGRLEAAEWFFQDGWEYEGHSPLHMFRTREGRLMEHEPISSRDFYGNKLSTDTRKRIEDSI